MLGDLLAGNPEGIGLCMHCSHPTWDAAHLGGPQALGLRRPW